VGWVSCDQILECDPGRRAVATKTFPPSAFFFADHFPGMPVVPGVLLVELVAQTAGYCVRRARPGLTLVLGSVRSAKFRRPVAPGGECRISVEIARMGEDFALARGHVDVDGVRAAAAEVVLAMVTRERVRPLSAPSTDVPAPEAAP
jgi:3-hydroxyacyl-[acyl-carrier-protein] dehydratase